MASITKVMTALVVIRAGHLNREITIPSAVVGYVREWDASNAGLRPGDRLTACRFSTRCCSRPAPTRVCPGRDLRPRHHRVHRENERRGQAARHDPDPLQHLRRAALADPVLELLHRREPADPGPRRDGSPLFRSVVDQRSYRLAAGSGHHAYYWRNLNPLFGYYPGAIGIKPGYTGAAGQCLLFEATRNGYSVIGVTLHSPGSIDDLNRADVTRILNWAFSLRGERKPRTPPWSPAAKPPPLGVQRGHRRRRGRGGRER